jgi:hypothetical protein
MLVLATAQDKPVPTPFANLFEFRRDASSKTQAVVDLLCYHRAGDENTPAIQSIKQLPAGKTTPNIRYKAVVYTTFPSIVQPLIRVRSIRGI